VEEIEGLLKKAGFIKIQAYQAFSFNPPDSESERINFVALKI
jgi:hypothetical protein